MARSPRDRCVGREDSPAHRSRGDSAAVNLGVLRGETRRFTGQAVSLSSPVRWPFEDTSEIEIEIEDRKSRFESPYSEPRVPSPGPISAGDTPRAEPGGRSPL